MLQLYRHSYANYLSENGTDLRFTLEILGKRFKAIEIYTYKSE